jgi:hypothetical protein
VIAPKTQRLFLIAALVPYLLGALGWVLATAWSNTQPSSSMPFFSPAQLFERGGWFIGWFIALGVSVVAGANYLGGTRARTMLAALALGATYAVVYGVWFLYIFAQNS